MVIQYKIDDFFNHIGEFEDNEFDLCLTDPKYNINAKITKGMNYNHKRDSIVEVYDDIMTPEEYKSFSIKWYSEIKRISKKIIFTCGKLNLQMWYSIDNFHLVTWIIPNTSSRGYVSKYIKTEPILCSGDFKKQKLTFDYIKCMVLSGFVKGVFKLKHPHSKPPKLYHRILTELKPQSVIDPFLGSGTTAQACKELGIDFVGYEINPEYEEDIKNRLKYTKKQTTLI